MDRFVARLLCHEFNLGGLEACDLLGGTRNANYAFRTTSGHWFVRHRFAGYSAPGRVQFDHKVMGFLCVRGAPVLSPRLNRRRETFLREEERVWEVFPFVEGSHLREGSLEDVQALGVALAAFHEAGTQSPFRFEKIGPRGETEPNLMYRQASETEADCPESADPLRHYREWITAALRDTPDSVYASLPHTIVHGDIQPANLLLKDDCVAAFVDLDWCAWRPRIYDLAFGILFCCATHEAPIRGEDIWSLTQPLRVEPDLTRAFLEAYENRAAPLTGIERRSLRAQIVLSWCHSRIAGALKVEKSARAAFLSRPPHTLDALLPDCIDV